MNWRKIKRNRQKIWRCCNSWSKNGNVVINNTAFYLVHNYSSELKWDSESKEMKFFSLDNLPENLHDPDLMEEYKSYVKRKTVNWQRNIKVVTEKDACYFFLFAWRFSVEV